MVDQSRDGKNSPRPMPTTADNKKKADDAMKGKKPKEIDGIGRFWKTVLVGSVSGVLILTTIFLWHSAPHSMKKSVLSDLSAALSFFESWQTNVYDALIFAVALSAVVAIVLVRLRPWRRLKAPAVESKTEEQPAATAERSPPLSIAAQSAPPATKQGTIYCKICGMSLIEPQEQGRRGWFELVEHLKTHAKDLEFFFESLPGSDFAQEILETYFEEKK